MKKEYKIILLINIFLFIGLIFILQTNLIRNFDLQFYNFLISFKNQYLTLFMKIFTNMASMKFLIILTIGIVIILKDKILKIAFVLNLIFSSSLNHLIKNIILRERPNILRLIPENGYSFPSGHTMVACSFYGFIIYLIIKSDLKKTNKILAMLGLSFLILIIALSRIYLGVHYITDIFGAILLAIIYLILFISTYQRLQSCNKL